ncbi:hypothetical protein LOTGIDRAFT_152006 [Lottia gigantea]|uniref:Uncharacterized protein n=1 Tax=Lottia gigantea TaxID=225164 RepID=V4BC35_LOTGI|nr:hypothetical protein LOTGIDRAFT_152006 [Lottia gigantea]ESP05196.1 hypothetical protein LOTGIDRAFT_152006 [Lottia gigantea]
MTTTFEVILFWCNGFYWTLPGWTECKNNISEITISSVELERTESSFKLIIPSGKIPLAIDSPSSHKTVASKLSSTDDTLPPSYLQFGVSIHYDEEFSPIVWNTTKQSDGPSQENHLFTYIIIAILAVIVLIISLLICCDSENGAECTELPTNQPDQNGNIQRHNSGVGTFSISTPSSYSSPSSTQIVIPVSSTGTSKTSSTGEFQERMSCPQMSSYSSLVTTEGPKQDALRNALATKDSLKERLLIDTHTSNSSSVLMLKPKSQSKDNGVADEIQLMEYSIATIQKTKDNGNESENSSASISLPCIKSSSSISSITNKLHTEQQLKSLDNSDAPDNKFDENNYPSTSIVCRPDSEEIMC